MTARTYDPAPDWWADVRVPNVAPCQSCGDTRRLNKRHTCRACAARQKRSNS